MSDSITYSVILPIYNEEAVLAETLERLLKVLNATNQFYEVICVDDASTDRTWEIIQEHRGQTGAVKGLRFSRNFGHQLAIFAGIKHSRGEFVAVLDADGQDPPELLPELWAKCREGYDVVYAVRQNRKESLFKRTAYKLFYRVYKRIMPFDVPVDAGDFSVFTRGVADFIGGLREHNPFIRGLRSWYGGRQTGIAYDREERGAGRSKYSYWKLILLAVNGAVSFSKAPLRSISLLGITASVLSLLYAAYLLILKITVGIPLLGWTSTALLIIFFGGLNLFVVGITGEYIGDIFEEVKKRPPYLIRDTAGLEPDGGGQT